MYIQAFKSSRQVTYSRYVNCFAICLDYITFTQLCTVTYSIWGYGTARMDAEVG